MSQKRLKKIRKSIKILEVTQDNKILFVEPGLRNTLKKILRENIKWLLLMTAIIFGIYFNSLWGGFVSDDYASITQNPYIDNFGYMFNKANSMSFSTYLVKLIFGFGSSIPFHAASLLGFIIFCWVAYVFLEIVFKSKWLTRLTMLLFAFLPIHVEAVSWISGRIYVVISIYVMISFIGIIYYLNEHKTRYLALASISFLFAFLTDRPRPFVVFLITAVYLLFVGFKNFKINWGKFFLTFLSLGILFVIISWSQILSRINIVNSGYNSSESIFYNPFFQYPTGISKYLQLLWIPIDLTLYHTMYVLPQWLNWAIILMYVALTIFFYFKNKPYFFALAFIVAAVLPSIMPIKVSWLVAERYMFLGSLGFCLFLALIIIDLSRYSRFIAPALITILVSFYGVRLFLRNIDWQTNHNLWVNTCQVSPNSHNAWNNIGDDYDKLKDYSNAVKGFTQSVLVKPNYADAYHNRANIFFKTGRLDLARESYTTALNFSPTLYQTYLSLIQIDLMERNGTLALAHAQKAVELQPNDPQAQYVLGIVYAQTGRLAESETIMQNILTQNPGYQPAVQALQQIKALMTAPNEKKK